MNQNFLIPLKKEAEGLAKNILKGAGLALLKPKLFSVDVNRIQTEITAYQAAPLTGYDKIGLFGLPVWDTVKIYTPTYTDDEGNTVPSTELDLEIALVEITNPRNIVKTMIAGRNGTINEYMSDGDDQVVIRGCLVGKDANLPPLDLIAQFKEIKTAPVAVNVESNFINYMGIYYLVIDEPVIRQREGTRNVYDIELNCSSDTPFELEANA